MSAVFPHWVPESTVKACTQLVLKRNQLMKKAEPEIRDIAWMRKQWLAWFLIYPRSLM